jgi:hypothetical protein
MTTARAGTGGILFRSVSERRFLFYLLAASAVIGPGVVLGVGVPHFWTQARDTAYVLMAAAAFDFAITMFVAFAFRYVEVTFDGRHVRIGSGIFKTSIPVAEVVSAEAVTGTGGRRSRGREYIKLITASGAYRAPCRNAQTLVRLIQYHRPGGG